MPSVLLFTRTFTRLIAIVASVSILLSACKKDKEPPTVPELTTTAISDLTYNSATTGGAITSDGGASITASGVCWSENNVMPTIVDSVQSGTTSVGSFTFTLHNLSENTTYYVRSFATNSVGTGYGNVVSFSTAKDTSKITFIYNGATVTYGVIKSPTTGRQWLDRNIGASQAATAVDDYLAYGDLFQWGRPADGHQLINYTSATEGVGVNGKTSILATSDIPGNNLFITPDVTLPPYIEDWQADQNDNRWATNNQGPCPSGWHVPTKDEWDAEISNTQTGTATSGGITDYNTAFTLLKITVGGHRYGEMDGGAKEGIVLNAGLVGRYWGSSVGPFAGYSSRYSFFGPGPGSVQHDAQARSFGESVRCIKD
jgi:uncharacterized protein (TIGR02145 family)